MDIILASASPRRRELLAAAGVEFSVCAPDGELSPIGLSPAETVTATAEDKARRVAKSFPDALIIAADTMVYLDGEAFGKPRDEAEARAFLRRLSGRTHEVYTGVCVLYGGRTAAFYERTAVEFREIGDEEITRYIATGEPLDKAGAYGAQGRGAAFIRRIDGDFFSVMGLPICALGEQLLQFGVNLI